MGSQRRCALQIEAPRPFGDQGYRTGRLMRQQRGHLRPSPRPEGFDDGTPSISEPEERGGGLVGLGGVLVVGLRLEDGLMSG